MCVCIQYVRVCMCVQYVHECVCMCVYNMCMSVCVRVYVCVCTIVVCLGSKQCLMF